MITKCEEHNKETTMTKIQIVPIYYQTTVLTSIIFLNLNFIKLYVAYIKSLVKLLAFSVPDKTILKQAQIRKF